MPASIRSSSSQGEARAVDAVRFAPGGFFLFLVAGAVFMPATLRHSRNVVHANRLGGFP